MITFLLFIIAAPTLLTLGFFALMAVFWTFAFVFNIFGTALGFIVGLPPSNKK